MSIGGSQRNVQGASSASGKNVLRGRGMQPRFDDGFHSKPVRNERDRRRKFAIALAVIACVLAAIFVVRSVGDRDERVPEPSECTDLYTAEACELLETP